MSEPLDDAALNEALRGLPAWSHEDDALVRTVRLGDFRQAMAFLVRVGFEAEQRNHHPELRNVYDEVTVRLTTHDAGNLVTRLDVELAKAIDGLV
jgi:4a-hydroxytetrahydrobiopterin dehydratase